MSKLFLLLLSLSFVHIELKCYSDFEREYTDDEEGGSEVEYVAALNLSSSRKRLLRSRSSQEYIADSGSDEEGSSAGYLSEASSSSDSIIELVIDTAVDSEVQTDAIVTANKKTQVTSPSISCSLIRRTPSSKISDKLKELIGNSSEWNGCFYNFTLYDVAAAIVQRSSAMGRENYSLVVNHAFKDSHCEALKHLVDSGVKCYFHKPIPSEGNYAEMHCKICVIKSTNGEEVAWQGSWNCTGQADENNVEMVTLTDDPAYVAALKQFIKNIKESRSTEQLESDSCVSTKQASYLAKRLNRIPGY